MSECKDLKPTFCGKRGLDLPSGGCSTVRIEGADDVSINQGVCIDLTEGVHAYDGDGSEIEYTVSPSEIGCCDVGEHEITYRATGKGDELIPSFCMSPRMLHVPNCGIVTKTVKRIVTILQALPPKILGIERKILPSKGTFDALEDVYGIDDNGEETAVTFNSVYDDATSGDLITVDSVGGDSRSLKVALEPIQEGSGTPSPDNIRPISGWTEVVTQRTGRNLFSADKGDENLSSTYGVQKVLSNDVDAFLSFTPKVSNPSLPNNTSFGFVLDPTRANDGFQWTLANGQVQTGGRYGKNQTTNGSAPVGTLCKYVFWYPKDALPTILTQYDIQIELGSTATDFEPYQGTTYTTSLGQTVYGGTLDVVSGELVVDRAMVTFDGTETWTVFGTGFLRVLSDMEVGRGMDGIANWLPTVNNSATFGAFFGADNQVLYLPKITENISGVSDATTWSAYLANNPLQVAYPLATPQTIQLTPQEVELLTGTNNVWAESDKASLHISELGYPKQMPSGEFMFQYDGIYEVTYDTEDSCGNHTTETRLIYVGNDWSEDSFSPMACLGQACAMTLECSEDLPIVCHGTVCNAKLTCVEE